MIRPVTSTGKPYFQWRDCGYIARSLGSRDACERYISWMQNTELMTALNMPARKLTLGELSSIIASFDQRTKLLLGIYRDLPEPDLIGIFILDLHLDHRIARISGFIGEKGRHRNIMAFTRSAFDYLFENRGVEKIGAQVAVSNRAAIAACSALGMRKEGLLRGEIRKFDGGGRIDQIIFGLLREDRKQFKVLSNSFRSEN
jgi:RimJ/RimL family protein N-acetyltransferase